MERLTVDHLANILKRLQAEGRGSHEILIEMSRETYISAVEYEDAYNEPGYFHAAVNETMRTEAVVVTNDGHIWG